MNESLRDVFARAGALDYFQHCVHCGLCLPRCPTYVELADENDSPRGRIYLLQAMAEGRLKPSATVHGHLEACLNCRGCETACPSGVEYGVLIEGYRLHFGHEAAPPPGILRRLIDVVLLEVLSSVPRTRWLLRAVRLGHAVGLFEFLQHSGLLPDHAASLKFPEVLEARPWEDHPLPPRAVSPTRRSRAEVALFMGCVSEAILPSTNRATHRVLLHNGCTVHCPTAQACCGALHYHAGDIETARDLARLNIAAFEAIPGLDAVVVNVAGCGMMLKDYGSLLADDPNYAARARRFAEGVRDVHEFLVALPLIPPQYHLPRAVAYHEPCHLCHGQGIRQPPRDVLAAIPGLELRDVPDADLCCGAAGAYSITQPGMAGRLARRKLDSVAVTAAGWVAAGNAGCILHLEQHAALLERKLQVVHPIELLDEAYQQEISPRRAQV